MQRKRWSILNYRDWSTKGSQRKNKYVIGISQYSPAMFVHCLNKVH